MALDFTKIGQIEKTAIPGAGFLQNLMGRGLKGGMRYLMAGSGGANMASRLSTNAKNMVFHPLSLGFTGLNLASAARPSSSLAGQGRVFGQRPGGIPQIRQIT